MLFSPKQTDIMSFCKRHIHRKKETRGEKTMQTEKNNCGIFVEKAVRMPTFQMNYEHFHTYCELFYLKTGNCTYSVNGKQFHLQPGDIFIAAPGENHCTKYEGTVPCERIVIYCEVPVLGEEYLGKHRELREKLSTSGKIIISKKGRTQLDNFIDMMLLENYMPDDYSSESLVLFFKQVLLWIERYGIFIYEPVDTSSGIDGDIETTMRLVAENYANPLTLEEAADKVGLSPTYLSKKFKKETGKTFSDYLNYIRLRQACQMLLTTDDSVTEIAFNCGFNSSNYFKDCFKRCFGVSPRVYKTQSKNHSFE